MAKDCFVTLGPQRYRMQRPWPAQGFRPDGISDVAVMRDGRIAALMRSTPQLVIFASDGKIDAKWTLPRLVSGHYLSGRPDGGLLVADWDGHQVLAVGPDGTCVWSLGDPERPRWMAPFSHPTSAAETPDGRLYVSDGYGNFCLHRFGPDRRLQSTLGTPGTGRAEFSTPHCVIVDDAGNVHVADRENNRIQTFDAAGAWLGEIGHVYKPMALAFTPDGAILATDQTPCLCLLSGEGEILGRCRTTGMYAHGLDCAPDGSIYLAEMLPASLVKLTPVS